ncbi:hypothetical protein GCM10009648_39070 [Tsukamurella spumae]
MHDPNEAWDNPCACGAHTLSPATAHLHTPTRTLHRSLTAPQPPNIHIPILPTQFDKTYCTTPLNPCPSTPFPNPLPCNTIQHRLKHVAPHHYYHLHCPTQQPATNTPAGGLVHG